MTDTNRKGKRERKSDYPDWLTRALIAAVGTGIVFYLHLAVSAMYRMEDNVAKAMDRITDLHGRVAGLEEWRENVKEQAGRLP